MPKEKLWFTQDMHHLRCWACAFLSCLSGITQGSQLQRLKSQTNAAGSTLITNEGNFHATNWHGKTFVPPQLLGKNHRSSGNPEPRKSACIDWMITIRKWEFPGIYELIFFVFFFFHLDDHSKLQWAHSVFVKMSSETKQSVVLATKKYKRKMNTPFPLCFSTSLLSFHSCFHGTAGPHRVLTCKFFLRFCFLKNLN